MNKTLLKLFNSVEAKAPRNNLFIDYDNGVIITPEAVWAKKEISEYYQGNRLSGEDLNKTFHKSWEKIVKSSRLELLYDQILHYISTYGSNFDSEIYIPDEVLEIPNSKLKFLVVSALTKDEIVDKCLGLLKSGIALKEETIDEVLNLLKHYDYQFEDLEGIRNKEASIKISDKYGLYPKDPSEFFRYVLYRTTGCTLLIKDQDTIQGIKDSNYNPSHMFKSFGLDKCAQIFNRFKPLFLAYKNKCPKVINKISKLSKVHHKPMIQNPLNLVTSRFLNEEDKKYLDNATIFSLFKALNACQTRINGQDHFSYRIRNGKSWVSGIKEPNTDICKLNWLLLVNHLKETYSLEGKKVFYPQGIDYALPTSEKMFVGNIPTGTKIFGSKLAVGVYWEDSWGAKDLDLSGVNLDGKVGWNSAYNQRDSLLYSGDITSAPKGAVEYLWNKNNTKIPTTLINNNVYSGDNDCGYKIIVGEGDDISKNYMMNPEKLLFEVKCQSIQKQTTLGMFSQEDKISNFTLLNFGSGNLRVSENSKTSKKAAVALEQQYNSQMYLKELLVLLGAVFVGEEEEAEINLSLDSLTKTTFIDIFKD